MTEKAGIDRLFDNIVGIFTEPTATLQSIADRRGFWAGFAVYMVVRTLVAFLEPVGIDFGGPGQVPEQIAGTFTMIAGIFRIYGILILPAMFFVVVAVWHMLAMLLGSQMPVQRFAAAYGYTFLPAAIGRLIGALSGTIPQFLLVLSSLIFFVWVIVLQIIAFRVAYNLTWLKALAGYFLPSVAAVVMSVIVLLTTLFMVIIQFI